MPVNTRWNAIDTDWQAEFSSDTSTAVAMADDDTVHVIIPPATSGLHTSYCG